MPLPSLVDALHTYLTATVAPSPHAGGAYPATAADLPAVTVSMVEVQERIRGLGRLPMPTMTGALRVDSTLDLATPVAVFPDETVTLLSPDRKTVQLAHGPLVRADGSDGPPWTTADLDVVQGATTFTPVAAPPAAGEVQVLDGTGQLVFPSALPATGQLALGYFVGEWGVRAERYHGTLLLETFAVDAAGVETLSRKVDDALQEPAGAGVPGLTRLDPVSWGPILPADATRAGARSRAATYRFDFELVEPHLPAGGGLIVDISVDSTFGPEHFDVVR